MPNDHLEKQPSKSDMAKQTAAWKTLNTVLVQTQSEFMKKLNSMLVEKEVQHEQLKEKIEKGEGTEEENALFIFLGGYIQCLKDILHVKKQEV